MNVLKHIIDDLALHTNGSLEAEAPFDAGILIFTCIPAVDKVEELFRCLG